MVTVACGIEDVGTTVIEAVAAAVVLAGAVVPVAFGDVVVREAVVTVGSGTGVVTVVTADVTGTIVDVGVGVLGAVFEVQPARITVVMTIITKMAVYMRGVPLIVYFTT